MYLCCLIVFAAAGLARADVSFKSEVAPILVERCLTCHNADKNKGEYRVDSFDLLMRPGESKRAPIVVARPQESHLFQLISSPNEDERMPGKGERLAANQVELIERWIKEGAKFDGPDPQAALITVVPIASHPQAPQSYPRPVPITALAFSPDGTQIAAGGYHEITLW